MLRKKLIEKYLKTVLIPQDRTAHRGTAVIMKSNTRHYKGKKSSYKLFFIKLENKFISGRDNNAKYHLWGE